MRQWLVIFSKEQKEMLRNYKWIWVPLVFILLGAMQPITSYYLPQILESLGGLPEGAVFEIPMPTGSEVLVATLGQFSQVGILVLILSNMGIVASERSSGAYLMVLVKPVSFGSYITAKWASITLLSLSALFLGYVFAAYYTHVLIGGIVMKDAILGGLVYGLWLTFIMTLVILFSSFMKSNGAVAFLTLGITILLSITSGVLTKILYWTPARLTTHSQALILTGEAGEHFWLVLFVTIGFIALLLFLTLQIFKKKELVN